jgi:hypothetical protein
MTHQRYRGKTRIPAYRLSQWLLVVDNYFSPIIHELGLGLVCGNTSSMGTHVFLIAHAAQQLASWGQCPRRNRT